MKKDTVGTRKAEIAPGEKCYTKIWKKSISVNMNTQHEYNGSFGAITAHIYKRGLPK
jgi:hypothetical protein